MQGLSLALNGASLVDDAILADSGVMEAASLELVATWSEALLAQQLVALLLAQGPMSRVELDDAHCCRFGVSGSNVHRRAQLWTSAPAPAAGPRAAGPEAPPTRSPPAPSSQPPSPRCRPRLHRRPAMLR